MAEPPPEPLSSSAQDAGGSKQKSSNVVAEKAKKKKNVSKQWQKQLLEYYDGRYWQFDDNTKRKPKRNRQYDSDYENDGFKVSGDDFMSHEEEVTEDAGYDNNLESKGLSNSSSASGAAVFAPSSSVTSSAAMNVDIPQSDDIDNDNIQRGAPKRHKTILDVDIYDDETHEDEDDAMEVDDIQEEDAPATQGTRAKQIAEKLKFNTDTSHLPTELKAKEVTKLGFDKFHAFREKLQRKANRSDSPQPPPEPAETELPIFPRRDTPPPSSPVDDAWERYQSAEANINRSKEPRKVQASATRKPVPRSSSFIDVAADDDDSSDGDDFMDAEPTISHQQEVRRRKRAAVVPEGPRSELEHNPSELEEKQRVGLGRERFLAMRQQKGRNRQSQLTFEIEPHRASHEFDPVRPSPPAVRRVVRPPRPQEPQQPARFQFNPTRTPSDSVMVTGFTHVKLQIILTFPHQQTHELSVSKTATVSELISKIQNLAPSKIPIAMVLTNGNVMNPTETVGNYISADRGIVMAVPSFPATHRGILFSDWIKSWQLQPDFSAPKGSDFQGLLFSHLPHFAPIISQAKNLISLRLDRCAITPPQFQIIASTLIRSSAASIQHLSLSRNALDASSVSLLASALLGDHSTELLLESLDLSHNPLSDNSARHVSEIVAHSAHLHTLRLRSCSLTPQFFKNIQNAPFSIPEVDLSLNFLGTEGISYFISALYNSDAPSAVRHLNLERNQLDATFADEVPRLLSLGIVDLSLSCNALGDQTIENLAQNSSELEVLDLSFCSLTGRSVGLLLNASSAAPTFSRLRRLNLRGNHFKECLFALQQFLIAMPKLEHANLSYCGYSASEHAQIISGIATSMQWLRELILLEAHDRAMDLDALDGLLSRFGASLQRLDINCFASQDEVQQVVAEIGWEVRGSTTRWSLWKKRREPQ